MRPLVFACALLCAASPALGQQRQQARPQPAAPAAAPAPEPETPLAYEPQLLRLSETLGVIAWMSQLCGEPADPWRQRVEQLIEAEAVTQARKERFAGAYNRGFLGHQAAHRTCTERGRLVLDRKLKEAREIAQDVSNRFGG